MEAIFNSVLYDRNVESLTYRLDQLDQMDIKFDTEIYHQQDGEDWGFPIEFVLYEIYYANEEDIPYLEQVLFWMAERTSPNFAIINCFSYRDFPSSFKVLEELLKKYDGEKIPFSLRSKTYNEILMGYGHLDLESLVECSTSKVESGIGILFTKNTVLPIENAIITYALGNGSSVFKEGDLKYIVKILKRYGSPDPSMNRIINIIYDGFSLYQRNEEDVLKRLKDIMTYTELL